MARSKRSQLILLLVLFAAFTPTLSHADDAGLVVSAEASHKFKSGFSASAEAEFRTRNNFRTADRISLGVDGSYKLLPWLKASAGYSFLIDNNKEEITYHSDGEYNNWRPSYWGTRHRFNVSLTASWKVQRVELSLRERWQYTYRPEKTIDNFDFDEADWEDKVVRGKGKNVWRNRLEVEWNIPHCKWNPFVSAETFVAHKFEKLRCMLGVDHSIRKVHKFSIYYRYQYVNDTADDPESNMHMLGVGYTYKF